MEQVINRDKTVKSEIIKELQEFGCCNLCILRYIGNTDAYIYRTDEEYVRKLLFKDDLNGKHEEKDEEETEGKNGGSLEEPPKKIVKRSPCSICLGLLDPDHGTSDEVIEKIVQAVKEAGIQAKTYTVNLSLPIAVHFRAHFIWYKLLNKFPKIYESYPALRPDGICVKTAWKWVCTGRLKEKVDPQSDWNTDGNLMINVSLNYEDEGTECAQLKRQMRSGYSRVNLEDFFRTMGGFEFIRKFGDSPKPAQKYLTIEEIKCTHATIFIAGRYCKYSRNVSQTPWIVDGKKVHEGSVEELISEHVLPLTLAEKVKFSASGREDVDVRMLGQGRPFLLEIISPKRTFFIQKEMNSLRDKINQSTKLISVRDVQVISKRDSSLLKDGEESKTKSYCALCLIPEVTSIEPGLLQKLNEHPLPIVLQQKTPLRVLHRRSLITRERSVYSMKAMPTKQNKNLFKLFVKTQAGTYVKEFVHGDLGRTRPSVQEILGVEADIVSLDVQSIDFPWPPTISD